MPEKNSPPSGHTREERLAAALRENLRRRKAQAREFDAAEALPKSDEPG